ncbi:MAG TPA: sigma-70 family RNA polymerase sigma factor [Candidatus Dormibacteraeota bacterium]|jgi:RNA polymerase sigma-70 factor (ECF subfamily)|nr:sigma-70 family RNA polymerase sigma factor [Candidatus Dormibacteraeota bacterium]
MADPVILSEIEYRPGNLQDFDLLYRRSYGRLKATLIGVLADPAAAEDCVQDAFVQAFKAWPNWRPDAPAEAWLHRIALNTATSYRRRQKIREVGEIIRRLGRPEGPPDPSKLGERSDLLLALTKLPPKQAAAIVLRHYHGFTNREIALSLGVPERTVASRLAAARSRLQSELDDQDAGPSRKHLEFPVSRGLRP